MCTLNWWTLSIIWSLWWWQNDSEEAWIQDTTMLNELKVSLIRDYNNTSKLSDFDPLFFYLKKINPFELEKNQKIYQILEDKLKSLGTTFVDINPYLENDSYPLEIKLILIKSLKTTETSKIKTFYDILVFLNIHNKELDFYNILTITSNIVAELINNLDISFSLESDINNNINHPLFKVEHFCKQIVKKVEYTDYSLDYLSRIRNNKVFLKSFIKENKESLYKHMFFKWLCKEDIEQLLFWIYSHHLWEAVSNQKNLNILSFLQQWWNSISENDYKIKWETFLEQFESLYSQIKVYVEYLLLENNEKDSWKSLILYIRHFDPNKWFEEFWQWWCIVTYSIIIKLINELIDEKKMQTNNFKIISRKPWNYPRFVIKSNQYLDVNWESFKDIEKNPWNIIMYPTDWYVPERDKKRFILWEIFTDTRKYSTEDWFNIVDWFYWPNNLDNKPTTIKKAENIDVPIHKPISKLINMSNIALWN